MQVTTELVLGLPADMVTPELLARQQHLFETFLEGFVALPFNFPGTGTVHRALKWFSCPQRVCELTPNAYHYDSAHTTDALGIVPPRIEKAGSAQGSHALDLS